MRFGVGFGIFLVVACTGSDPDLGGGSSSSSGSSSGGSSGTSGGCPGDQPTACGASCTRCPEPTAGSGQSTCTAGACGIACNTPSVACGAACVDLSNDASSCGRCGRACGAGSTCAEGRCSTQLVVDVTGELQRIVVAGANVIFSKPDEIQRVAKTGGATTPVHSSLDPTTLPFEVDDRSLLADAQKLYWAGKVTVPAGPTTDTKTGIFAQNLGGQPGAYTIIASYYNGGGFAATDGTTAAWTGFAGNTVFACAAGTKCETEDNSTGLLDRASATNVRSIAIVGAQVAWVEYTTPGHLVVSPAKNMRTELAATDEPDHLAVFQNVFYWTDRGSSDGVTAKPGIYSCPLGGCGGTAKRLVTADAAPTELTVDASGIYFTTRGDENGATGTVSVCKNLVDGCGGTGTSPGPEVLAKDLARPKSIGVDDTTVFFTVHPVSGPAKILRVAK